MTARPINARSGSMSSSSNTTRVTRVPELLNPGSTSSEMALPESSQSAEEQPDMTQSKPDDWDDKKAGLTLGSGQLRLKIEIPFPAGNRQLEPSKWSL